MLYAPGREKGTCIRGILHRSTEECIMHYIGRKEGTCMRVIQVKRLACPESSDPHNLLADLIFDEKNYGTAHFEAKE